MAFGKVQGLGTRQGYMEPAGYGQITSLVAENVGFSGLTIPDGTTMAMIQPETQNIRWRDDGIAPTAAVGMIVVANDIIYYSGPMSAFRMIQVAASAKVNVTFYK